MSTLRELREKQGLTQAQVAELAKTTQPMIGRLENGKRVMTVKWARTLAPILKTTPDVLLLNAGEEDEQSRRDRLAITLKRLIDEHGIQEVSSILAALLAVSSDDS